MDKFDYVNKIICPECNRIMTFENKGWSSRQCHHCKIEYRIIDDLAPSHYEFRKFEEETMDEKMRIILDEIKAEFLSASNKFNSFKTYHEGYAVILEELDELWNEVKAKEHDHVKMKKESIQIAAMALRFVYDLLEVK